MNQQESFDESKLRVPMGGPGPDVRSQILSAVDAELRCRRRDRRLVIISLGLMVFAGVANMVVGQRETTRLARWYTVPSRSMNSPILMTAKPSGSLRKIDKNPFRPLCLSPWRLSGHPSEIDSDQQQILEWIWEFSGTKGAI